MKPKRPPRFRLVVCLRNDDYPVSLEPRKIYCAVADRAAAAHNLLRVIDESGEDYLYPTEYFAPIRVAAPLRRALKIGRRATGDSLRAPVTIIVAMGHGKKAAVTIDNYVRSKHGLPANPPRV